MDRITLGIASFFFLTTVSFAQAPKPRYISLAPSTTEILFALGLDEEIAGVSTFCNYPGKALAKEKIGDFSSPNIEKILALKPDFIFCTGLEQAPVILKLKRLGLKVYVADPVSLHELFETIRDIGRITARDAEAAALIEKMKAGIDEVDSAVRRIPSGKRKKVFIEIWHDPLLTAGKGSLVGELAERAGGINIAGDIKGPYAPISAEQVISRDPDCIIMTYMEKAPPRALLEGRFGWSNITAVRTRRVFNDINPDTVLRPGPRIVEGLKEIHKRLYP